MLVNRVRHDWPEKADFGIDYGDKNWYSFFHFPIPFYIRVNDEIVLSRPDACIMLPPMAYRYFHCYEPSTHNFLFLRKEAAELVEKYNIPLNELMYLGNTSFISDMFQKMELEFYSDNPHKEVLMDGYVEEFLIKLSRAIYSPPPVEVSVNEQIMLRNVRQAVLSQCEKKWTVSKMAALASLSPSRFHAVYSSIFGTTPINDLSLARIHFAKVLLRSKENYTIQDITEKVGYQSQCHFINKFKQITGKTPSKYRKKHR